MSVSSTGERRFPADQEITHQWVFFSNAPDGWWERQRGTRTGRALVDVSGSQVEIAGTNSGDDTRVIFAEELGEEGIDGSAIGVVTYGDGALESVGATEYRMNLYDTEGTQKSPIGVGDVDQLVTSGATAGISGSVALDLGPVRQDLDIAFETVSAGALIADVAKVSASRQASGAPWRRLDSRSIASGGEADMHQLETTYRFARAWISGAEDADVDLLEMASQGVS